MLKRLTAAVSVSAILVLLAAVPAFAEMDPTSTLTCHGHAEITGTDDGKPVHASVDSADKKAKIPREGDADYLGEVSPITRDHSGEVFIQIGPIKGRVGHWGPSRNADGKPSATGVKHYSIPSWVPPLNLKVSGYHTSSQGRCEGSVELQLLGSPFSSPVGIAAVAGTALTLGGLLASGVAKAQDWE